MRVYLGRRRHNTCRPVNFFSLRNFPLHLDMAEQIGLDTHGLAAEMAIGLAICHWRAHVDCNDVEFVLGAAPTVLNFAFPTEDQVCAMSMGTCTMAQHLYDAFPKRTAQLWMLDFDKCNRMPMTDEGIEQAIRAVEMNDPYFPKPECVRDGDRVLWEGFKRAYLKASERILEADGVGGEGRDGPGKFIRGWEECRRVKIESGKVESGAVEELRFGVGSGAERRGEDVRWSEWQYKLDG